MSHSTTGLFFIKISGKLLEDYALILWLGFETWLKTVGSSREKFAVWWLFGVTKGKSHKNNKDKCAKEWQLVSGRKTIYEVVKLNLQSHHDPP